jgi:arylsulfatase A-like enzyme
MGEVRRFAKLALPAFMALSVFSLYGVLGRGDRAVDLVALLAPAAGRAQRFSIEPVEVGGVRRKALVPQRPRIVVPKMRLFDGAWLTFGIALREETWSGAGDGVTFTVKAALGKDSVRLFSRYVDAKTRGADRRWIDVRLPIAERLRERGYEPLPAEIDLVLSTAPGMRGDARDDAPVWADLRIEGGGWRWPAWWPSPRRPNVVLISIDTLRDDRVGGDGRRSLTPNMDRVAASGFRFRRAYAPSNHTLRSHMSLLTGLYPRTHGVQPGHGEKRELGIQPLPESRITLAETLHANGYATGGFAYDCVWLDRKHGFAQGFERYAVRRLDAAKMNDREILPWLRANHRAPFFLFIHYYDVHSDWRRLPYDAPDDLRALHTASYDGAFTGCDGTTCATRYLMRLDAGGVALPEKDLQYVRSLYDAGVEATDREVGRLLDELAALGVLDETLVLIVSDHGEELREHGRFIHTQLYDEIARIPMILRWPRRIGRGGQSLAAVSLLDVAPTVLDLAGIEPVAATEGRSLLPLIEGRGREEAPIFVTGHDIDAVLDWPWKLIRRGAVTELYDLEDDPDERRNLAASRARERERMDALLASWLAPSPGAAPPREREGMIEAESADVERLRALGYIE